MEDEENHAVLVAAPASAPARPVEPEAPTSSGGEGEVTVYDEHGVDQGFKLDVAPKNGESDDVAGLASRVKGWTKLVVDGEEYKYSEANARTLVSRFPHVAASMRRHDEEAGR